ncbi:MAG: hypothetical protein H7Y13_04410 [Sphingobacteriaceae bacterium]|nr:hypothetical protein [Sphingobacteriaceae bacterium]
MRKEEICLGPDVMAFEIKKASLITSDAFLTARLPGPVSELGIRLF